MADGALLIGPTKPRTQKITTELAALGLAALGLAGWSFNEQGDLQR
jgi:hypothetical protein